MWRHVHSWFARCAKGLLDHGSGCSMAVVLDTCTVYVVAGSMMHWAIASLRRGRYIMQQSASAVAKVVVMTRIYEYFRRNVAYLHRTAGTPTIFAFPDGTLIPKPIMQMLSQPTRVWRVQVFGLLPCSENVLFSLYMSRSSYYVLYLTFYFFLF